MDKIRQAADYAAGLKKIECNLKKIAEAEEATVAANRSKAASKAHRWAIIATVDLQLILRTAVAKKVLFAQVTEVSAAAKRQIAQIEADAKKHTSEVEVANTHT